MRAGGEKRGNSYDRKRRRAWLLATFDPDLGPDVARCHLKLSDDRCHVYVDDTTLTVDRIDPKGGYQYANCQPACTPCQNLQGALITAERRHDWQRWMDEAKAEGIEWDGAMA